METIIELPLYAIAHSRAGDKGNRTNISLIPYRPEAYRLLSDQVTEERVLALFKHRGATRCRRYDLPRLAAFNFVIDDALEGGVNGSLNVDGHGKTQSFRLLSLKVTLPRSSAESFVGPSLSVEDFMRTEEGAISPLG